MDTPMDKTQLAYDYVQACQTQDCYERKVHEALKLINPDNQVFGLADPLRSKYEELVALILGEEVMDWIYYWQYEADYGKVPLEFRVNDREYNTQDMTLYKYLEVACGLTK